MCGGIIFRMDINLMVLNVGNTRLAIGVFVAGELQYVNRISHDRQSDWAGAIQEAWSRIASTEEPGVAAAGVNPPLIEPLEHIVQQVANQKVQWVGRDLDLPIKVLTETPGDTGIDRILNIAAAYEQMGKACVVVDAGTAITVDVCNDKGEFLGGAIAPGMGMILDALHERTARLPRVDFAVPQHPFGQTTDQSILHGAFHGIRGMVKELVENYATELGDWPEVIATGGDALRLFENWEMIHAVSGDLTLYGIALAYAQHHIRHGT